MEGVKTDRLKVTSVEGWSVIQNVSELRNFLGLYMYYQRFAVEFTTIATVLHHLPRKGASYE